MPTIRNSTRRARLAAVGVAAASALALSGCASAATAEREPERSSELTIAVGDISGGEFDPLKGWGSRPAQIRPIHSSLLTIDENVEFVGDLASDYTVSEDGLTWTFTIRDDARWSTGEPVQASDVVFTYELLKQDGTRFDLSFVDRIEATDESTVQFTLTEPRSTFVSQLSEIPILPEEHYGPDYSADPIGSGPYRVVDYQDGQQVILEENPHWYGGDLAFDKLTFLFLSEDAALAAARKGTVDVAYVPPAFADQQIDGMTLQRFESIDSRGLTLPTLPAGNRGLIHGAEVAVGNDVTSDIAVRQALNIGLDRDALVDAVLQAYGEPAFTLVDGLPWFNPDAAFEDGRVADARELLSDGGWTDDDGDGVVEKNGVRAAFTLLHPADDQLRSDLALVVAEQAAELGIEITPQGTTWDGIYLDGKANAVTWGGGRHHAHQMFTFYSSSVIDTGYNNMPQFSDPTVDAHLEDALRATDQDAANEAWRLAQWDGTTGVSGEEGAAPVVWLLRIDHLYLVRDGLDLGDQPIHGHGHEWALFNSIAQWKWSD